MSNADTRRFSSTSSESGTAVGAAISNSPAVQRKLWFGDSLLRLSYNFPAGQRSPRMPPRASWKGFLRISLVTCPIALFPATSASERISFNRINRKTGQRVRQLNVDAKSGEKVEADDIAKGYEVDKGQYVLIDDDELDAIQIEAT